MQKHAMAEKKKVFWDGIEIDGLMSVGDITLEKSLVEVAEFNRKRQIQSDVTTVPAIEMEYLIKRDSNTLKFFRDFYNNNQVKDCVIARTDAHGVDFERRLIQSAEMVKTGDPAYDAKSPVPASIKVTIIPWDIIGL